MQNSQNYLYKHFRVAMLFLVVSASYGLLMRFQHVVNITKFVYANFLQAHSHVTFLGWGFLGVTSLITVVFLPKMITNKTLNNSFWIMVLALIGMLISFPLQGYKLFSILFLSVFLITSYVYLGVVYKNLRNTKGISSQFIRSGILYYYLSSMAIWGIPIIKVKLGKGEFYNYGIAFYTHFLYNGFFVMVLFGLLMKYLIDNKVFSDDNKAVRYVYSFTVLAAIPTFLLVFLKEKNISSIIVIIAGLGTVLQLFSLVYLKRIFSVAKGFLQKQTKCNSLLLYIVSLAYLAKLIMQFFSAFPTVTQRALLYSSYLVIGYIHLFTLGFMTLFLLLLYSLFAQKKLPRLGILLFVSGIILSEGLLFLQGGLYYFNFEVLTSFDLIMLLFSSLMPIGLLMTFLKIKPHSL